MIQEFFNQLLIVSRDAAPWLLFGLMVAGLIKVLIPTRWLNRWLGGRGIMPMVYAALLGTPLPLCSCSVVPVALSIRRSGASRGATTSFLIATPENGADSIALSYALLGPVLMIARPVAAIIVAIVTGFTVSLFVDDDDTPVTAVDEPQSCCSQKKPKPEPKKSCCCSSGGESASRPSARGIDWLGGIVTCWNAMLQLLNDIAFWLVVGLVLAALISTFVSHGQIASWGSGLPAMILMVLVGIPMYICATSSTPVAASLFMAGMSPGTVLVFLLAGPATNLGTVGIIRKELGTRTAGIYLAGVAIGSIAFGLLLDQMISSFHIGTMAQQLHEQGKMLPDWLSYGSMALLGFGMLIKALKSVRAKLTHKSASSCCHSVPAVKTDCCTPKKPDSTCGCSSSK